MRNHRGRVSLLTRAVLAAAVAVLGVGTAVAKPMHTVVKGAIESLPDGSLIGDWVIDGTTVTVTDATEIDDDGGPVEVGAMALAKGSMDGDVLLADEVKTLEVDDSDPMELHLVGEVEALPGDGLIGTWTVAGESVVVTEETEIDETEGAVAVGVIVEVEGYAGEGGVLQATSIEVQEGPEAEEIELTGVVEALPDGGLIGLWTVSGQSVNVTEETEIDETHGAVELGVTVEVEGYAGDGGVIDATKVKVEEEGEENDDGPTFVGDVEALPDTPDLLGEWLIEGRTVVVSADTELLPDLQSFAEGARVKVWADLLEDGTYAATRIAVLHQGDGPHHPSDAVTAVLHLMPTEAAPEEAEGVVLTKTMTLVDGMVAEDLKVAVEHLLPAALYDVVIDTVPAGTIMTNEEGEGSLFLSTRAVGGAEPLPADLRPLTGLEHIDVLDSAATVILTGEFADAMRHTRQHPGDALTTVAVLVNGEDLAVGAAVARATEVVQTLEVAVWGLTPGESYLIWVDDTDLAEVVADHRGRIQLSFGAPAAIGEEPIPDLLLPVSGLVRIEIRLAGDTVAGGDFGPALSPPMSSATGTLKRRLH